MDGTLLNDEKQLPPDFWDVANLLNEHNVLLCIASGRQYYTLKEIFDQAPENIAFIAENGAFVVVQDEVLHEDVMHKADAIRLLEQGRKVQNANLILCCKNGAYVEGTDEKFLEIARQHYYKLSVVDDLTQVDDAVLKITLCDFDNSERNSLGYFSGFGDNFKISVSGEIWLDIVNSEVNKGAALRRLQQKLDITREETAVFGDYLNDLEMMKEGKFSFAMKNSHPDIAKIAAEITKHDNNGFGVTNTIKELFSGSNY
jgi:hypothetical protein